jgi:hypothetical protein
MMRRVLRGLAALLVRGEAAPSWETDECVFGVLALEPKPVGLRL